MKRAAPRHPKTAELAERLGDDLARAVGSLELLWHFCAEFAPRGDVGRFSDRRIEAACDWNGKPSELVKALVACRWLDEHADPAIRLIVHDWHAHCEDSVKKRLERASECFLSHPAKVTENQQTSADNGEDRQTTAEKNCLPKPLPSPLPVPRTNPCATNAVARVVGANGMTSQQSSWFATWWSAYWRKVSKKTTQQAFKKHVCTEARFQQVMQAMRAQSQEMLAREPSKRPHGATWLNAERWDDELPAPQEFPKSRLEQLLYEDGQHE